MAKAKLEALALSDDEILITPLEEQIRSSEQYDSDSFLDGMSDESKQALYSRTKVEEKDEEEDMNTTPTTIMDVLAKDLLNKLKQSKIELYNFSSEQVAIIINYIETKL